MSGVKASAGMVDRLSELDGLFPASVTVTRTSESDFKSRQLVVHLDEERIATLLWGDSVTRELTPGRHRLRVHNTLVWKTVEFVINPGEQVFFEAVNRVGPGTYLMLIVMGIGPLYVSLRRMARHWTCLRRRQTEQEISNHENRTSGEQEISHCLELCGRLRKRARAFTDKNRSAGDQEKSVNLLVSWAPVEEGHEAVTDKNRSTGRLDRLRTPEERAAPSRSSELEIYLIDGTYELFRHYYALPSARDAQGREVAAVRGVVASVLGLINRGVTHLGVATDHVIESFRNRLWAGYKTSAGVDRVLLAQFPLLEEALAALGVAVWPMIEYEADDALASAAAAAAGNPAVSRVVICTPDKDLAQSVRGTRVVQLDRRRNVFRDEAGVVARFGVAPESIPDYLALVGDSADGYPGLPGWGVKSAAAVLARFRHLEAIPADPRDWHVNAANAGALSRTLERERDRAKLFRDLATLRADIPLFESVEDLRWSGPTAAFAPLAASFDAAKRPDPAP